MEKSIGSCKPGAAVTLQLADPPPSSQHISREPLRAGWVLLESQEEREGKAEQLAASGGGRKQSVQPSEAPGLSACQPPCGWVCLGAEEGPLAQLPDWAPPHNATRRSRFCDWTGDVGPWQLQLCPSSPVHHSAAVPRSSTAAQGPSPCLCLHTGTHAHRSLITHTDAGTMGLQGLQVVTTPTVV